MNSYASVSRSELKKWPSLLTELEKRQDTDTFTVDEIAKLKHIRDSLSEIDIDQQRRILSFQEKIKSLEEKTTNPSLKYKLAELETELTSLEDSQAKLLSIAKQEYIESRTALINSSIHIYDSEQRERLNLLDEKNIENSYDYMNTLHSALLAEMSYARRTHNSFHYRPAFLPPHTAGNEPKGITYPVLDTQGNEYQTEVVSLGNIISFTIDKFIAYDPEARKFRELDMQPRKKILRMLKKVPDSPQMQIAMTPVYFGKHGDQNQLFKKNKTSKLLLKYLVGSILTVIVVLLSVLFLKLIR